MKKLIACFLFCTAFAHARVVIEPPENPTSFSLSGATYQWVKNEDSWLSIASIEGTLTEEKIDLWISCYGEAHVLYREPGDVLVLRPGHTIEFSSTGEHRTDYVSVERLIAEPDVYHEIKARSPDVDLWIERIKNAYLGEADYEMVYKRERLVFPGLVCGYFESTCDESTEIWTSPDFAEDQDASRQFFWVFNQDEAADVSAFPQWISTYFELIEENATSQTYRILFPEDEDADEEINGDEVSTFLMALYLIGAPKFAHLVKGQCGHLALACGEDEEALLQTLHSCTLI